MQAEELIDQLREALSLDPVRQNTVNPYRTAQLIRSEPQAFSNPSEVDALLEREVANLSGWIARQSGVEVWKDGKRVDQAGDDLGAALAAELGSETRTLQLRYLDGEWSVVSLTEGDSQKTELAEQIKHMTVRHGPLIYHRYWSLPSNGAAEPIAARLIGFGDADG